MCDVVGMGNVEAEAGGGAAAGDTREAQTGSNSAINTGLSRAGESALAGAARGGTRPNSSSAFVCAWGDPSSGGRR